MDLNNKEEEMASSAHFYLNWAKERIDEMDAVLGSLEGNAGKIAARVTCNGGKDRCGTACET